MAENQQNLEGQIIKGYQLQKLVGQGGFGQVYRAHQALLKRDVAVKVILPRYVNDPDFIRRFEAEAQLVSQLENIHIVPLYDFWRDQSGAYLVMRWLRGGSLSEVLAKGHWPIQDTARVVSQLAVALSVAHRNGVIHRDIKPANILLDEEHNVYLADFGIAKDVQQLSDFSAVIDKMESEMEGFIGSPDYISPEQIRNAEIGPESDIYNFGLVIYELLTGKKPFDNLPVSTLISRHLMTPLPNIQEIRPDLPEELNSVITKATAKDPKERYSDTLQLASEFRDALAHTSSQELYVLGERTAAFDLETLGLPADFFDAEYEPINPYKGLRAFRESDADDFFGRETLINKLLGRFDETGLQSRFLALIGPSGSGKSSIMRAGLVPKLRNGAAYQSDEWFIVDMLPSAAPMIELEAALLRIAVNPPPRLIEQLKAKNGIAQTIKQILGAEGQLLLVIDQFEEVFTMLDDESERQLFLRGLADAIQDPDCNLRIILTLRADFYDRPLLYPEFGQLISDYAVTVLPLSAEELSRAITEPAERVGLHLERGLVAEIIADVGEQPSTLPLLQYALTELFERRQERQLTRQAYQEIGGVTGALARRADELFTSMSHAEQNAIRQLFLRLITPGEGTEDTRRRARLDELLSLPVNSTVMQYALDTYGQFRLLSFDRDPINRTPTVEIAHEALIRQWTRLRDWLNESRDDLRLYRRLAAAANEWQASGRETSYLISGARLQQFEDWLNSSEFSLSEQERAYLDASLAERSRLEAAQAEQAQREAALKERARNFLYVLVAVMALATIGAFSLSLFAFNQQAIAETNAAAAVTAQGQALAESNNAATSAANARDLALVSGAQLALSNGNTDLAILLSLQANQAGSSIAARRSLAESAYARGTRWLFNGSTERLQTAAFSPDGLTALVGGNDHDLYLLDAQTGALIRTFEGHNDWVWDVTFSPDGTKAVSASADFTLILWDVATGEALRTFAGHTAPVSAVAMNADGSKIFSGSDDKTVIVWDTATGEIIAQSADTGAGILDVDVSPSGFTALSGHTDGSIRLWNLQAAQPISTLSAAQGGHTEDVWAVRYLPDESGFVSGSQDSTLIRWSFETQAPVVTYLGHNGRVTSLDISADGSQIVSGSEDNSLILWDTSTGSIINRFIGHTFLVYAVAISPDGQTLLSSSWDNTARLWDMNYGAQVALYPEPNHAEIRSIALAPNGKIATASNDGAIYLWNDGQSTRLGEHLGGANVVVFNADGSLLLSGGADNVARLWDMSSNTLIRTLEGHSDKVTSAAFSSDGRLIATGSDDNTIILWDAATGEQVDRLFGHTFHISDLDFSPNSEELVSSAYDNLVLIWDVASGEILHRLEGHADWIFSVEYSPNGATVLSAAADNRLILWDAESGTRLRQYEGHSALIYDAHFSADGTMLISASADRSIIIWDIITGQVLQTFSGHTDAVTSLSYSPDNKTIISASADGTIRTWALRLTVEELQAWISSNRRTRELSCVEQEVYGLASTCPTPTPFVLPNARA